MSLDKIRNILGSLTKSLEDNKQLMTPILANRLAKYTEEYPQDQTLGAMFRVIDKMADNKTLLIKKSDFKSLYNKLYTKNTMAGELFKEELDYVEMEPSVKKMAGNAGEIGAYEVEDKVLLNALHGIFGGEKVKAYSNEFASKAMRSVHATLDAWGVKPTNIVVDAGNEKVLIIKASYETPKGLTSFYVPIGDDGVVGSFVGNSGVTELNHTNVKNYITSNAGVKLNSSASVLLSALTKAAGANREISDAEIALTKLTAARQGHGEFFEGIIGMTVEAEARPDVYAPKLPETESFEKQFSTPYGTAAFNFGTDKVKLGSDVVLRNLNSFGYNNVQISVINSDNKTIFYGVSLPGTVGFTVPVKLADKKVMQPTVIMHNGLISSFNKESISEMYKNNSSDYKIAAAASPLYELKASELIDDIKKSVLDGNIDRAEDALNVLVNSGDAKSYAIGFKEFMNGLAEKTASHDGPKCNMVVKSSTSQHPICGHTGLPLHKTFIDKFGNCLPLYRKVEAEAKKAKPFITNKIFG